MARLRSCAPALALGLALLTGCGSGSGTGRPDTAATPDTGTVASGVPDVLGGGAGARPLSTAQLDAAALTQKDIEDGTVTDQVSPKDFARQSAVDVDDASCAPLAYVQSAAVVGKPTASVQRMWIGEPAAKKGGKGGSGTVAVAPDITSVFLTLAAYDEKGAARAMADLSRAADDCAHGYTFRLNGERVRTAKVKRALAPEGADEALGLTLTVDSDGTRSPLKVVVARKGSTIAYFPAVNLASVATGADFSHPSDLVRRQLAKMG
ncbi:hypothetical protein [Streptomyces sp. VRA16 Mangrove soil]|uniref:hypothetical protein n=1 Tax=Streptomyces sp. VRA16 Mangrove soil TaxID=2817434 RepID=UPI001A9FC810|nr:hypothetical protein [Streptomyces sp. VRA16 Mangrove soil]MBO1336433.1 hypothetical protein [Streptomyces sp. VRA16 Mangrove soil]